MDASKKPDGIPTEGPESLTEEERIACENFIADVKRFAESTPMLRMSIPELLTHLENADPQVQARFWGMVAFEFAHIGDERANERNAQLARMLSAKAKEMIRKKR